KPRHPPAACPRMGCVGTCLVGVPTSLAEVGVCPAFASAVVNSSWYRVCQKRQSAVGDLMAESRIRVRAYFLFEDRTGRSWADPVSNWLQATEEEQAIQFFDE